MILKMGVSEKKYHQMAEKSSAHVETEKRVSFKSSSPLKPVLITKATTMEKRNADDEDNDYYNSCDYSTTPTGKESRISNSFTCPPAPKKRKPASSRCINYGGIIEFFSPPHDLESIFICRVEGLN